jgi:hypothetical protein
MGAQTVADWQDELDCLWMTQPGAMWPLPVGRSGPIPQWLPLAVANIPAEMRTARRWVRSLNKVPYRASGSRRASSTDPTTWSTFEEAHAGCGDGYGLGFMLG